jgi:hypothetical protein
MKLGIIDGRVLIDDRCPDALELQLDCRAILQESPLSAINSVAPAQRDCKEIEQLAEPPPLRPSRAKAGGPGVVASTRNFRDLRQGAGETGYLMRNGNFRRRPHQGLAVAFFSHGSIVRCCEAILETDYSAAAWN